MHFMILQQLLLTYVISNSYQIRFFIAIKLYLNQMVYVNNLFSHKMGGIFQGYGSVKLMSVYPSYYHYLSYCGNMNRYLLLVFSFTNQKLSLINWCVLFMDNGWSMQQLLVIWTIMAGWGHSWFQDCISGNVMELTSYLLLCPLLPLECRFLLYHVL